MEIKRTINNKSCIFCVGIVILCFILGYFLLVGIDKIKNVTIEQLLFSTYTVFTQFGQMIFPFVVIFSINVDYREKNILFYKSLNINEIQYYLHKVFAVSIWFLTGIIISIVTVSIVFNSFSYCINSILYFFNTTFYTIILSAFFAFIMKNMLGAFGINLAVWIGSIILCTVLPDLKYIAYYDASNVLYSDFEKYLETSNVLYLHRCEGIIYNVIVLIMLLIFVKLASKKWSKNGIT